MNKLTAMSLMASSVAAAMLLNACSTPSVAERPSCVFPDVLEAEGVYEAAPNWICQPSNYEGATLTALGIVSKNKVKDFSLRRTAAIQEGRSQVAASLGTKAKAMYESFSYQVGLGEDPGEASEVSNTVRNLTNEYLKGAVALDVQMSRLGTVYALVGIINTKDALDVMSSGVAAALNSDDAKVQQFMAWQKREEMDKFIKEDAAAK